MVKNNILKFNQPADFFYRSAQKQMDDGLYIAALSTIRKAVIMEPENKEFSLFLAEILTELNRYEESNRVIFGLMEENNDADPNYFFGLGCNFMGLNDITKAKESFLEYLKISPDGDYIDEIEDFLDYCETNESYIDTTLIDIHKDIIEKSILGKKHLDKGEYDEAIKVLETIDDDGDIYAYIKNNLSLAYYCADDIDKAIATARKILKKNPYNIHANCNLALFMRDMGDQQSVEECISKILDSKNLNTEDLYKISVTLCELNMHTEAVKYLGRLVKEIPYDEKILFYFAASLHNSGRFKEALVILDKVKKLDYPGVIAEYYIKKINNELENNEEYSDISYIYQVTANEGKRKIQYLNDCLKLSQNDFLKLWHNDEDFYNTILWGLEYGDDNLKRAVAGMVATFADKKAEKLLRRFLLKSKQSDSVKNDIFIMLKKMNAKEPYVAYIKNEIVEVKVGAYDTDKPSTDIFVRLVQHFYTIADSIGYDPDVLQTAADMIGDLFATEPEEPDIDDAAEIAAAMIYLSYKKCDLIKPFVELCALINADEDLTKEYINLFSDKLELN